MLQHNRIRKKHGPLHFEIITYGLQMWRHYAKRCEEIPWVVFLNELSQMGTTNRNWNSKKLSSCVNCKYVSLVKYLVASCSIVPSRAHFTLSLQFIPRAWSRSYDVTQGLQCDPGLTVWCSLQSDAGLAIIHHSVTHFETILIAIYIPMNKHYFVQLQWDAVCIMDVQWQNE